MSETLEVAVAGVSHTRARLELRERLHVDAAAIREHLVRTATAGAETVVLSTCNRVEAYTAGANAGAVALRQLHLLTGVDTTELRPVLSTLSGREAAAHLFAVAGGLDSAVVGETQILGQVRDAHRLALEAGTSGRLLGRLFRQAVETGRRIRAHAVQAGSPISIPAAAVRVAEDVFGSLEQRTALVLGAGRAAELTVLELVHRRAGRVVVSSRTVDRAEQLARRFGALAVPFARRGEVLAEADVVVSATAALRPVVDLGMAARAAAGRGDEPLLFLDVSVPRDVDPRIAGLAGCWVYDVDQLVGLVAADVDGRAAELARARALADAQADVFHDWLLSLRVVPAIAALRSRADAIRSAELARVETKLAALEPRERRVVESLTAQIVNKLLHEPTVRMKDATAGPAYAGAVRHLFALDGEEVA